MIVQIQALAKKLSTEWWPLKLYFFVRIYHKPDHLVDFRLDAQYEQNQLQKWKINCIIGSINVEW